MSIPERLAGKVAIVTGAGRGIGRTIADTLASEGASVAVAELNMEAAQESVDLITEAGGTAVAVALNLGKVETIAPMIDQVVAAFGRLDILVNNAGLVQINPFLKVEEEEWDRVMNVNLKGTFFCLQAAAKQMEKQGEGGRIISMSSISGRGGRADSSVYAASKMGIISITRSAALALADKNILVNAICPGIVPTPMWDQIDDERARLFGYEAGTARAALVEQVPLKRVAEAEEVSAVVAFLASSDSSFITGQAINVDGGMEMD
jgi:meso-butanediol dehydrogenase / (S,S)-butanediol dehydrogenase / diacetyl reductase